MLIQGLANEFQIRIDDGRRQRLWADETLRLNSVAHGVRMHAQFTGDGTDFPCQRSSEIVVF
jgi:hypothetical protein